MVVFVVERAQPSLRGELSRWLFEVKAGVFVGKVSALVREELWQLVTKKLQQEGSAVMIFSTNTEQGFTARTIGDPSRLLVDIEGVLLVKIA